MRMRSTQPTPRYGSTWTQLRESINMHRKCQPVAAVQCGDPTDRWRVYIWRACFRFKVVHAVKTFSTRSCQQYYIYKSTKHWQSWSANRRPSVHWVCELYNKGWRAIGDKKYKGSYTCVNPHMNEDHRQLDVLYIYTLIRSLLNVELAISVAAIQSTVVWSRVHTRAHTERPGQKKGHSRPV